MKKGEMLQQRVDRLGIGTKRYLQFMPRKSAAHRASSNVFFFLRNMLWGVLKSFWTAKMQGRQAAADILSGNIYILQTRWRAEFMLMIRHFTEEAL